MLRHHLLVFFRNLRRHRSSSIINILGMSTGMACAMFIALWVADEWSFDRFHQNNASLYQVMERSKEDGAVRIHEATQGPLAEAMKADLPEVQDVTQVLSLVKENVPLTLRNGTESARCNGIFASDNFFKVFSFSLLRGNAQQVLADKQSIVLSEATAIKLFGSAEAAIGKQLDWDVFGKNWQVVVTGVAAPLPNNNSLVFDFVMTRELLLSEIYKGGNEWYNEGMQTYLLLKPGTNIDNFNAKIKDFIKAYDKNTLFTLFVRPYADGYLLGRYENGEQRGGRIDYVKLFAAAAIFVLIIACINFMNLSTARAARRAREVGIRKVMGGTRKSLALQFLVEAVVISLFSVLIALLVVWWGLPYFNQLTGKQLTFGLTWNRTLWVVLLCLATGLLSGSYPAFYLSGFRPVAVLKGKLRSDWGELIARKGLVVFQFVISLVLLVGVMAVYRQVNYLFNRNPGYNPHLVVHFPKDGRLVAQSDAFMAELRKVPGVVHATATSELIAQESQGSSTYGIDWPGKNPKANTDFVIRFTDNEITETLGITVKEGRSFSKEFGDETKSVLLNETAANIMGLKNPVGTKLRMWNEDIVVVGVVRDFHVVSMHKPISPLLIRYNPQRTSVVMAKIEPGKQQEAIAAMQKLYRQFNPGYPFEYNFLDTDYQQQYVSEGRVNELAKWFAGLAILISCLGLFGLATFNAEMRTREIGIRKVLGASTQQVVFMLSKDYFKLIVIATLVASPVAWWLVQHWLQGYAYHTTLSPMLLLWSFLSLVIIMMITISFQATKAALANPVNSIRTE